MPEGIRRPKPRQSHAPGPWRWEWYDGSLVLLSEGDGEAVLIIDPEDESIDGIIQLREEPWISFGRFTENHPDARLIASAPDLERQRNELLEACKEALLWFECFQANNPNWRNSTIETLRQAIAAATGETDDAE